MGIGQAALDAAVAYAKERQQFGQPIAAFQGIQFMLADMAMQVHAARLMVHHAARQIDMGIRCSPTVALHFTDCAVPVEQRLGDEGEGFKIAMQTLDITRPMTGAMGVGIGQAALEAAVAYAKERQQFGQPIAAFQGIQFMLADMAMQVHAARLMVHHAARQVDLGIRGNTYEASMAKCWAGDAAMKVATDAVQIFGGYG